MNTTPYNCPCCSGNAFTNCCEPILRGISQAYTAEQLMRSRYTAYARSAIAYILKTTHSSTRNAYNATTIKDWADSSTWKKLEIISIEKGAETDVIGYVQFKAYFLDDMHKPPMHHEYSTFKKVDGIWYFVDGKILA
jgi:SEC-C motif domain protein